MMVQKQVTQVKIAIITPCPHCQGMGSRDLGMGAQAVLSACSHCGGTGSSIQGHSLDDFISMVAGRLDVPLVQKVGER